MAQLGEPEIDCPLGCGLAVRLPVLVHSWPAGDPRGVLVDVTLDREVWEFAWEDHLLERHPIGQVSDGRP